MRIFPRITLAVFLLPLALGLFGTWLPAFGYLPVIGAEEFGVAPFQTLFAHPSFPGAVKSTLVSGLCATFLSLLVALWIAINVYGSRLWYTLERLLAPLLAIPHASFAIGFSFLIAPSGWLMRILSPTFTGFQYPPDWSITGDPWAISLTATMILKEIPFLLLMIMAGTNQLDIKRTLWVGRSLGYQRFQIWLRLVLPQLYPMLRLPVLTVLAYSLSVVDLAIIIGPSVPPTFAVLIDRWFNDPDLSYRLVGAAGATLLFFITTLCVAMFLAAEIGFKKLSSRTIINGKRQNFMTGLKKTADFLTYLLLTVTGLSLAVLALWSFTKSWRFPDMLPLSKSFFYWQKSLNLLVEPLLISALVGAMSTVIAIVLVIGCFENEMKLARSKLISISQRSIWIIYLPLLIPQIGFLFGVQTFFITLRMEGTWLGLIWVHLVFVLPYVFLTLANTYRSYDIRYVQVAKLLSGSPWRSFVRIKLPMLAKPILFSLAIGFAVSIAQYLPTLYVGAGRFSTITTETVSLASGSDRRIIAVYALCQLLLPFIAYSVAIALPAIVFRKRKAMQN